MGRIVFLGTGTSNGIPVIGCKCSTCTSSDPRNHRYRCGFFVEAQGSSLLIDTPVELRLALLRSEISETDAVFFTHEHADHICGFDDLKALAERRTRSLPCYALQRTAEVLRQRFDYVTTPNPPGGGVPNVKIYPIEAPVVVSSMTVVPLRVLHGRLEILGFRIGSVAYITDCSDIPEPTMEALEGIRLLVLGALRHRKHPTHMNVKAATAIAKRVSPDMTLFTHIAHDLEHASVEATLPAGIRMAYDGLEIEVNDGWLIG